MNKTANSLMELLIAITAIVGSLMIVFWILDLLFGKPDNQQDLQLALRNKDERITQLTGENEQLATRNGELAQENARLRRLLHWWTLAKEFIVRLAVRLIVECAKMTVGVILKFA